MALSDTAHCVKAGDRAAAGDFLLQAAEKYAASLQWNPANPQVNLRYCPRRCGSMHLVSTSEALANLRVYSRKPSQLPQLLTLWSAAQGHLSAFSIVC